MDARHVVAAAALVVTTQNVQLGMTPAHVRHDIRHAAEYSSVVMTQEMFYRHAARYAPPGWGTAHWIGRPRGDCAVYWDRDRWRLVGSYVVPITWATFPRGHRTALVTVLRGHGVTVGAVCVHMFTHTLFRPLAWGNGVRRVSALAARLRARWGHVVIGGDWNRNWLDRPRIGPRFVSARSPADTGPKGGRPDFVYWAGARRTAPVRVIRGTYSDHNGTRYRLALSGVR